MPAMSLLDVGLVTPAVGGLHCSISSSATASKQAAVNHFIHNITKRKQHDISCLWHA
jgi:hypothetical protein